MTTVDHTVDIQRTMEALFVLLFIPKVARECLVKA